MHLIFQYFSMLLILLGAAVSSAFAELPVDLLQQPVQVAVDKPVELSFTHPGEGRIVLALTVRAEAARVEGFTDGLAIRINDKPVNDIRRLLNKQASFRLSGKAEPIAWFSDGAWVVPIGPDFKSVDKDATYGIRGVEAGKFELDISDLVQAGENKLRLSRQRRAWSEIPLQIANVSVQADPTKTPVIEQKLRDGGLDIKSRATLTSDYRIEPGEAYLQLVPVQSDVPVRHLLRISMRRQHATLGGYSYPGQFLLNDKPIDAARDRRTLRLLNKETRFTWPGGRKVEWNQGDGIWLAPFTPDFNTDFSSYAPGVDEPYTNLLDVTDLVAADRDNVLTIRNLYGVSREPQDLDFGLVVSVDYLTAAPNDVAEAEIRQKPRLVLPLKVEVLPDGAVALGTDGEPLLIESTFSYPSAGKFNTLAGKAPRDGELSWKPKVLQQDDDRWTVEAGGRHYTLNREIERHDDYIVVNDTFHNPGKENIGIILSNHLNLKGHESIDFCRMGGRQGQALNNMRSRENPTLYFPLRDSGLGLVAADDVYRNHVELYYDQKAGQTGLRDGMLAIAPDDTVTLSWSIQATPDDDYFAMINRLREQWEVNEQVDGPIYFVSIREIATAPDDAVRKWIDNLSIRYIAFWEVESAEPLPEWNGQKFYGFGTGLLHPAVAPDVELLRQAVAKIRRVDDRVKVALYSHSFFNAPEKADDPTYKDSWITDANNVRQKSIYDVPGYISYQPVFPTLENSYGKAYQKVIDYLLNDLDLDWIYWDEINGPGVTVEAGDDLESYLTYNTWDRRSARIDPATGRIIQTCGFLTLLSDEFVSKVIDQVEAKGGFVLFNGGTTTRSRMQSPSFTETQDSLLRSYEMHLSTPLAYGLGNPTMAVLRARLDLGLVYARTHIEYPSDVVARSYPLTVTELGQGWIKGKERIITNRSGLFGWDETPYTATLYLYDTDGVLQETKSFEDRRTQAVDVKVPEGGIGILERHDGE